MESKIRTYKPKQSNENKLKAFLVSLSKENNSSKNKK